MSAFGKATLVMSCGTLVVVLLARAPERSDGEFQPRLLASATPTQQLQRVRVWKSIEWDALGAVDSRQSGIQAAQMASSGPDDLIVLDAADYSLKRLRLPGLDVVSSTAIAPEVIRTVSVPILGMTAWEDHVWLSSPVGQVVRIDVRSGDYLALPTGAYKVAYAPEVLVLFLPRDAAHGHAFATARPNGDIIREFGSFLADQARVSIALDGTIAVDQSQQHVFFAPVFGGFLASYEISGDRRFLVSSLDPSPVPQVRVDDRGIYLLPQPRESAVISLAASEGLLYALVRVSDAYSDGSQQERVIDVYEGDTGWYLYSLRVPGRPSRILVESGVLVTANAEGIAAWDLTLN